MTWSLFGILEIGMTIEEPFQRALKVCVSVQLRLRIFITTTHTMTYTMTYTLTTTYCFTAANFVLMQTITHLVRRFIAFLRSWGSSRTRS
jgi:hypothetical protein